jgi:MFS family permease
MFTKISRMSFIFHFLGTYIWLTFAAALMGKLCLAASFAVVYIHSGEIFPTTIRNSAMGLVSVAARCGGIVAPFIVLLGKK